MNKNLLKITIASLLTICLIQLIFTTPVFASDGEGDAASLLLLILLAGPIFFFAQYTRYRNYDKRHYHEKDTRSEITNIKKSDDLSEKRTRTSDRKLPGCNASVVEGSKIKPMDKFTKLTKIAGDLTQ
jgi:hypothetical protein